MSDKKYIDLTDQDKIIELVGRYQSSTTESKQHAYAKLSALFQASILEMMDSDNIFDYFGMNREIDYFLPSDFFKRVALNRITEAMEATAYNIILQLGMKQLDANIGDCSINIESINHKDENGKKINLNSIYVNIFSGIKKYLVQLILSKTSIISKNQQKYQSCLFLNDYHFFDYVTKSKELDIVIPAEIFFYYYVNYNDRFPGLFYREICRSLFYQEAIAEFDKALTPVRELIYNEEQYDIYSLIDQKWKMIEAAKQITHFIDRTNIRTGEHTYDFKDGRPRSNNSQVPHGRKSRTNNRSQLMLFEGEGIRSQKNVGGTQVKYEVLQALRFPYDYKQYVNLVHNYKSEINTALSRIFIKYISKREKSYEETGEVDIENWYRRKLDQYIFRDMVTETNPANRFNMFFLIDNSCSINKDKQLVMKQLIVLFSEVIKSHPEKFNSLVAYSQNSSGNKMVSMRQLVCKKKVSELTDSDLYKLLHLKQSGVNYDILAMLNMLDKHLTGKSQSDGINLVIAVGDAWPVSYGLAGKADVKEEQETVFNMIRKKHDVIITYYAVNQLYDPRSLHYDYFISLKSDSNNPMEKFVKQFPGMIDEILKQRST